MGQEDINTVASELKKLSPGYIPEPIFNEVARLAVLTAIEFVPLRKNNDLVEVLLIRRTSDDPFWPSQLHTPGTILRANDTSFDDAYIRLFKDELNCEPLALKFIGNNLILNNRGRTVMYKYIVNVSGVSTSGEFYDVNALPDDLLPEHRELIHESVVYFNKQGQTL